MNSPTEAAAIELLRAECSRSVSCPAVYHYDGCAYDAAPDDLTFGAPHNHPVVGQPAYLIGRPVDDDALLYSLHGTWGHGTAILCWIEREDPPEWRGQAFRSDVVTANPKVARATARVLRENGWNVR